MDSLLEILLELVLEIGFQLFVDVGSIRLTETRGRNRRVPAFVATIGFAALGGLVGGLSLLVWPERIVGRGLFPGASLVIGPLLSGAAMHFWGRRRRAKGRRTTQLATFHGGAAFALGYALERFIGVR